MNSCRAIVPVTKQCQSCGVEFACLGGCCWCSEVTLDATTRAELQSQFSDCLCRACLERAARDAAAVLPVS